MDFYLGQFDGRTSRVMAHFFRERLAGLFPAQKSHGQDEHVFVAELCGAHGANVTGVSMLVVTVENELGVFVGGRSVALISSYLHPPGGRHMALCRCRGHCCQRPRA